MPVFQSLVRALPEPLRRHCLLRAAARIAPGLRVVPVRFNGRGVACVDLLDGEGRQIFRNASFEPEFFTLAEALLPPERAVFWDVGANFGLCTFGLLAGRPEGTVEAHLFEANPHVVGILRRSLALHPGAGLRLTHGCVTEAPGTSRLCFDVEHLGGGHVDAGGSGTEVPNVRLDDYGEATLGGDGRVDLLKMDIEGCEPAAFAGAAKLLASGRVRAVYVEVSAENLARLGRTPEDTLRPLREAGFELFWCKDEDFERWPEVAKAASPLRLPWLGGPGPRVARLEAFPRGLQTDVLAVQRSLIG